MSQKTLGAVKETQRVNGKFETLRPVKIEIKMTEISLYIEPQSLVMTPISCFYCKTLDDTVSHLQIYYLFGLKCCSKHMAAGKRDCRAWMHKNGYVKLKDAFDNTALCSLLNILDSREFKVKRTSGEIQNGWHLNKGHYLDTVFIQRIDDQWLIPCRYLEDNDCIRKHVNLTDFSDIVPAELIEECLRTLQSGIYFSDFEEQCALDKSVVPEMANVFPVIVDGQVGRVLIR